MVYKDIRKKARESLEGKWSKAVTIILANISIFLLFIFIEEIGIKIFGDNTLIVGVIEVLYIIIEVALNLGLTFSFIKLKKNEEVKAYDFVKIGFDKINKAWGLALSIFFRMIIPIIILIVSIAFIISASFFIMRTGIFYIMGEGEIIFNEVRIGIIYGIIGLIGCLIDSIIITILSLAYSQMYFIAYDNPDMSCKDIVKKSAELMKGHKGQLFILELSFFGWIFLSVLSMGIGFIWLYPYMMFATMHFYDEISNVEKAEQEKVE